MRARHPTTRLPETESIARDELQRSGEIAARREAACESCDLTYRVGGDHRQARFIEDAMLEVHHLYRSAVPAANVRRQGLPEDGHLFALRGANMTRKICLSSLFRALGNEPD